MIPDLSAVIPGRLTDIPKEAIIVAQVPGFLHHLVGRRADGCLTILIYSSDAGARSPVRLRGLEVQFSLPCMVQFADADQEARVFTVITSLGETEESERYFLHVMSTLFDLLGDNPSLSAVGEAVNRIVSIFQKLYAIPIDTVVGVVGELMVIAEATDPEKAVASWHTDAEERYDFTTGSLRLEVKSNSSRKRLHGFSFEQCNVPSASYGIVVSVFVERSAGGCSLDELISMVRGRLGSSSSAMLDLEQVIAKTLGSSMPDALSFRFDFELARESFAWFDLKSIPAIRGALDPSITLVRFVSDLSFAPELDPDTILNFCTDFKSLYPIQDRSNVAKAR